MPIIHTFVSPVADGGIATEVRPQSNWNGTGSHVFLADTTTPGLQDLKVWVEVSGTSPTRTASLKLRDGGLTLTIASITY